MSTFATYDNLIEQKLADTSEVFFTAEVKAQATNDTINEILREYDIPEFMVRPSTTGQITFASGKADFPSDYVRMIKLWKNGASGVEQNIYTYIVPDDFDQLSDTAAYFWTEDYDPDDDTRKLFLKPISDTAIECRYIKSATTLVVATDESGLASTWDECVAYGATMRCLQQASLYDEARELERLYMEKRAEVYLSVKNPGGIKQGSKLKSRWGRYSLLGKTGGSYNSKYR